MREQGFDSVSVHRRLGLSEYERSRRMRDTESRQRRLNCLKGFELLRFSQYVFNTHHKATLLNFVFNLDRQE
jgi:hypothetical protein